MDIISIGEKLNELAVKRKYKISNLQDIRQRVYGRTNTKKIFSEKNLKKGNKYAFHSGGREELQFNIGEDYLNEKTVFRYGVAFSLERSKTKHTLMSDLNPSKIRYNKFVSRNPEILKDCAKWYHIDNKWSGFIDSNIITDEVFKDNYFIFIGKYFNKSLNQINEKDLHIILKEFDRLLPLYEYCLDEKLGLKEDDKRIMRLTWNKNNWEYPCGHVWREKNQGNSNIAYENQYGYGHEEWLFNERFRIDGYQYGYIRGVNNLSTDIEIIDQITLYTIREDKQRCLVGNLYNVEIIEGDEAEENEIQDLISTYKSAMIEELKEVNADFEQLKHDQLLPNVKFPWEMVEIFQQPIPVDFLDGAKFNRFQAYYLKDELIAPIQKEFEAKSKFVFMAGKASNTGEYSKTSSKKQTQVKRRHGEITDDLYNYLIESGFTKDVLSVEKTRIGGAVVDVALKLPDSFVLFEIKTSNTALNNIRQALGQIFEYAFLDGDLNCTKLIIVGPASMAKNEKDYFNRLRKIIKIKLEYWEYNSSAKKIEEKFIVE